MQTTEVPAEDDEAIATPSAGRPAYKLGGGMPIIVKVQGEEHHATAGCLVSDGHLIYALTARHACGDAGTPILSSLRSGRLKVGQSSPKQVTRLPFSEVYPDFHLRFRLWHYRLNVCSLVVGFAAMALPQVQDLFWKRAGLSDRWC